MNEPPSVAVTQRFLSLCEYHGSQHLVVKLVAVGCRAGVAGYLRATTGRPWDAGRMRAASIWSTCASDNARAVNLVHPMFTGIPTGS